MAQKRWSITQIILSAKEELFLPQYVEHLAGLLYLCSGQVTLTGGSEPPLAVRVGETTAYPAWLPCQLSAQEDSSILLTTFRCDLDAIVLPCRLDIQSFYPEILARTMEQAGEMVLSGDLLGRFAGMSYPEMRNIPTYVQSAYKIINECYNEELTLDELSVRVGRSKYHLSRAFRDYYHVTPGAYLTSVRLARAKELLAETDLPVREIGRRVGLSNSAYFTTLFKQRFGYSPKEYRALRQNTE